MRVRAAGRRRGAARESASIRGRLAWSAVLGGSSLAAVFALSASESEVGATLAEKVQGPGVWLASVAFPNGIHGSQPRGFLVSAILANLFVYCAFWFVMLAIISSVRRRR